MASLSEVDLILQTVMFALYGNQYESREEFLLLSVFQIVLFEQFETATEFGSLLRANTPASRMLTTYTRRGPGQSYLKTVLGPVIASIAADKQVDLEINPQKTEESQSSVSETELAERVGRLLTISDNVLQVIMDSVSQVPYGIRWICKQIKVMAKKKFPSAPEHSISSLVGAFFMLRYINPAIITPEAYFLVESSPSKNPRRTLTLITKLIQNLVNQVTQVKEPYMAATIPFVVDNGERTHEFLYALCDVPDFYECLEMEQYLALSKKDLCIRVSVNEIYGLHGMLSKYREEMRSKLSGGHGGGKHKKTGTEMQDPLDDLLSRLGEPEEQLPRSKNAVIDLPLVNLHVTDQIGRDGLWIEQLKGRMNEAVKGDDGTYTEVVAAIVAVIRRGQKGVKEARETRETREMKGEEGRQQRDDYDVWSLLCEYIAQHRRDKDEDASVGLARKALESLAVLDRRGVVSRADGFARLKTDVAGELKGLDEQYGKVQAEIDSLLQVKCIMLEHHSYLLSQLDSYNSYLSNIRVSRGTVTGKTLKYSHVQMEKEGIIEESTVPENRKANIEYHFVAKESIYALVMSYKGRGDILEMDFSLDDLLESMPSSSGGSGGAKKGNKSKSGKVELDCVTLNSARTLVLLNKAFLRKQ